MPDSRITNLTPATQMTLNDLFVIEQAGLAKSISGQKILNKLANEYGGHGGIRSITYTEPVPPSIRGSMRITFTDEDYVVDVPVYNGEKGESGSAAYVHIRYASVRPTQDSDIRNTPDKWMGIYTGASRTAPTTYTSYVWYEIKGQNGEDGSTPTVTVVGTDTLPAGSEASVTANTTPNGISLRFGIPRGYDGGGAGSVTSVGLEGSEGITVDGVSPIIGEGTFTVKHSNRIGAQSVQGVYPVTIDGNGHIKTYGSKATAEDIGASPSDHTHRPEDIGAIADPSPKTNGQVLSYNGSSWGAIYPYADMVYITASATLTVEQFGKMVLVDSSSATVITLPESNGDGTEIEIVQIGTGSVTIGGTVLSFENKTQIAGRYGAVVAKAIGDGVWLIVGCLD